MKVLCLSHSSASENLGGAELSLLHLIDEWSFSRPGTEFTVVARGPEGLLQPELVTRGVSSHLMDFDAWVLPLVRTDPTDIVETARRNSQTVSELVTLMRELQPDVVVTNTIISPWAALAASFLGIPHVWFVHEYGDLDHGLQFEIPRKRTFDDIGLLSDLVVANSRAVHDHIRQWIPTDKLMIGYPAIDLQRVQQLAQKQPESSLRFTSDSSPEALNTVMVGRLAPSKGQWRLLRAIAALRDQGITVTATLIGGDQGADAEEVKSLIDELGLHDRVQLVGETENPFWYIAQSDVGVTASNNEAFGRVTVEYLALGKPVIASGAGASAELVHDGVSGWLFDPDDLDDLVETLRAAHNNRDELQQRGQDAWRSVAEIAAAYPLAAIIERIEAVASQDASPMGHLPAMLGLWLDLPLAVENMGGQLHARNTAAQSSVTWRLGNTVLRPVRTLRKVVRRARGH